jgi:hypothetical protein
MEIAEFQAKCFKLEPMRGGGPEEAVRIGGDLHSVPSDVSAAWSQSLLPQEFVAELQSDGFTLLRCFRYVPATSSPGAAGLIISMDWFAQLTTTRRGVNSIGRAKVEGPYRMLGYQWCVVLFSSKGQQRLLGDGVVESLADEEESLRDRPLLPQSTASDTSAWTWKQHTLSFSEAMLEQDDMVALSARVVSSELSFPAAILHECEVVVERFQVCLQSDSPPLREVSPTAEDVMSQQSLHPSALYAQFNEQELIVFPF